MLFPLMFTLNSAMRLHVLSQWKSKRKWGEIRIIAFWMSQFGPNGETNQPDPQIHDK